MSAKSPLSLNPRTQGWKQFLTSKGEMLAAFDKAKKQDESHKVQTYRGNVAEAKFREWLSAFLPEKYAVTSGYVISQGATDKDKLPHYDVIIYDRLESPILWIEEHPDLSAEGRARAIPAEYVRSIIEVKSSLSPSTADDAVNHFRDLSPLLAGIDDPNERYKMYLPANFFWSIVFFELRKKNEFSLAALEKLVPPAELRGFFDGLILRGEGLSEIATGRITLGLSRKPALEEDPKSKRSLLKGGMFTETQVDDESYIETMLMWSDAFFAMYAYDLVALLNGTWQRGRLSSFHGFGLDWYDAE